MNAVNKGNPTRNTDPATLGPVGKFVAFFRLHWTRGPGGTETPPWVLRFAYHTWLVALLFKTLGSTWDESWHFKWQRDDLALPHLINSVGTGVAVVLVAIHTFTGMATTRRSQRIVQSGLVVFLVAAPLDVINHRVSGLDLTAWSPTHFMLFAGTWLMIGGLIDGWLRLAPAGRDRTLVLVALWTFFLENTAFPNGQQEYGILELESWIRGEPYAEPSLLRFAADQLGRPVDLQAVQHFALPIPSWLYPMWGIGVLGLVLAVAARTIGARWAATTVAGVYVAYRSVTWLLLVSGDFPPSVVPFYLVFLGLGVDLARRVAITGLTEALVGAAAITAFGFGALYVQELLVKAPPVNWWTPPFAFVLVAVLWSLGRPTVRVIDRFLPTSARVPVVA